MRKTWLLAGAACFVSFNAAAAEFTPYVSAKAATVWDRNTVNVTGFDGGYDREKLKANSWRFGFNLAVGAETKLCNNDGVRVELEYNYRKPTVKSMFTPYHDSGDSILYADKVKVSHDSMMVNAYYDFNTNTKFTPYVGGGIGVARLKANGKEAIAANVGKTDFYGVDGLSRSKNNFAWNVGAGVGYQVNENVTIDAGYRYVDNGSISVWSLDGANKLEAESKSHEFLLGVRYEF